ncbi:MAG: hypothetical protein ILM98_13170 [Kiritimatiellae bacterium]|nr:hypothetical protein [Kiritimatiellia bacterium]
MNRRGFAGLCPTNAAAAFHTVISCNDEMPEISWEPKLEPEEAAKRTYTIYGRESLTDASGWTTPTNATHRFFNVSVEIP